MSEQNAADAPPSEPSRAGAAGATRWANYLEWLREEVIVGVLSLSAGERRTTRLLSGWTPVELLSHVLHMERRWFLWGFLGEPVADLWGDWSMPEPWAGDDSGETAPAARWQVAAGVTADDLAAQLRAVGERTRAILATRDLGELASPGGRFAEDPPTLEWICFHVLAEYARHTGHLDIVGEMARADAALVNRGGGGEEA